MRLMQGRIGPASNAFLFATCCPMIDRKAQRVIRKLSAAEQAALDAARVAADAEMDEIMDVARSETSAWLETRQVVDSLIANLKEEC